MKNLLVAINICAASACSNETETKSASENADKSNT